MGRFDGKSPIPLHLHLDPGLQVLLLMLLMVLNLPLLEPYLRGTLHLRLMDMCLEPLLQLPRWIRICYWTCHW